MSTWSELTDTFAEMERTITEDPRIADDTTRAEGVRYLLRLIAGGIPMTVEAWDPLYPQFVKFLSTTIQFGLPATDCRYNWAAVHGDESYRIFGTRGTSRIFDIETREGHMAHLADWKLFDRRNEFEVGSDGGIEVVLSAQEQPGNWIKLPAGPGTVVMREYFYDWENEEHGRLDIERVGATYPPPPLDAGGIDERADLLRAFVQTVPAACRHAVEGHYAAPADSFEFAPLDFGWADLQYGKTHFECGSDEAIILEVVPPEAEYWSVQLMSHFWEALDWHLRQSSLNGHQAHLDDDGAFRAVISHADPGVANWLDAAGRERGLIAIRYFKAGSVPIPTLRKVPLASVRGELPSSTPTVAPKERQDSLRRRRLSVRRRDCD